MWLRIFDKYEISHTGDIRNVKSGHMLKQFKGKDGYMRIQIAGKTRLVHRLVAEAFLQAETGKDFVNHRDGNKTNNYIYNLEWCTRSENMKHAYELKLKTSCGMNNGRSKLTEADVLFIRQHYIAGDKYFGAKALAEKFGVARQTISAVAVGQNWTELITG